MEDMNKGNSSAPNSQNDAMNQVFDSQDSFFDDLENEVNGQVYDSPDENASQQVGSPQGETYQQNVESVPQKTAQQVDWEKRYTDSSREAQRMAAELKQLRPFTPVLNAMRKDGGLVDHVKDYLQNGGAKAKTMKEHFNLDEDFVFDASEAMEDPKSDSGRVFNAYIDKMVTSRVGQATQKQQQVTQQRLGQASKIREERDFKERNNMSDGDYQDMVAKAKSYKLSLDDINFLINRDKANANVASATKQDMLNQMKNVRNMPTTASGMNSTPENQSPDSGIFDTLMGIDSELDNLFG